jgi:hypothetical protein
MEANIPFGSLGDNVQSKLISHLATVPDPFSSGSYHQCDCLAQGEGACQRPRLGDIPFLSVRDCACDECVNEDGSHKGSHYWLGLVLGSHDPKNIS